jgi:hypothetical protein
MTDREMAEALSAKGWGIIPPQQYLSDMEPEFLALWERISPFTLVSPERGYALWRGVNHIIDSGIPGDFAECGVFKGGCCMLIALTLLARGITDRKIWLYDTFTGMTPPTDEDRIAVSGQLLRERSPEGWWASSPAETRRNLASTGYPDNSLLFVEGDVIKTLREQAPERLALLRLDTDWYESTCAELAVLEPRLLPGGLLILDDYGHFTGARKAADEYFTALGQPVLLHRTDYTGRVWIKQVP